MVDSVDEADRKQNNRKPPVRTSVIVGFSNAHVLTGGFSICLTFYADEQNEPRTAIMVVTSRGIPTLFLREQT